MSTEGGGKLGSMLFPSKKDLKKKERDRFYHGYIPRKIL
jgi:hypothetical protein